MSVKKLFLVALALVLLAAPAAYGRSAEAAPPQQGSTGAGDHTVTVTGYGIAYGAPDIVTMGLGVQASNTNILTAMDDTNTRMQAVTQALEDGGVAAEDIRTDNYSIYQDYSKVPQPSGTQGQSQQEPTYNVSISVTVTVRDPSKVGDLLSAAVSAGANMVNYIQFDIADRTALESQARTMAVDDAKSRAGELAKLLGMQVGDPLNAVENGGYTPTPMYGGGGGAVAAAAVPPISQGQLSVSVSVTITFALVSGS
jgi:uncharacterized protein YggE